MIIGWILLGSFVLCGGGCAAIIGIGALGSVTTTTRPPGTVVAGASSEAPDALPPPAPTDFAIEVIELERSCFGSAGCNVRYTISPTYVGTALPEGEFEVLYDVAGADQAKSDSFTVRDGQFSDISDVMVSAPECGVLTATPTRVL